LRCRPRRGGGEKGGGREGRDAPCNVKPCPSSRPTEKRVFHQHMEGKGRKRDRTKIAGMLAPRSSSGWPEIAKGEKGGEKKEEGKKGVSASFSALGEPVCAAMDKREKREIEEKGLKERKKRKKEDRGRTSAIPWCFLTHSKDSGDHPPGRKGEKERKKGEGGSSRDVERKKKKKKKGSLHSASLSTANSPRMSRDTRTTRLCRTAARPERKKKGGSGGGPHVVILVFLSRPSCVLLERKSGASTRCCSRGEKRRREESGELWTYLSPILSCCFN